MARPLKNIEKHLEEALDQGSFCECADHTR